MEKNKNVERPSICKKGLLYCLLLVELFCLSACLRYVPSRSELSDELGGEDVKKGHLLKGEAAFYKHENLQKQRLTRLIKERQSLAEVARRETYRIGPGDLVELNVFDVEELNREIRVRPSGVVALPLVGKLEVAGLTEDGLQELISKKLEKFLQFPQVSIFIKEYAAHRVSVIGEVANPGTYSLKTTDFSLVEAISQAGGRTELAGGTVMLIPGDLSRSEEARRGLAAARASLSPSAKRHGIEIFFDDLIGNVNAAPVDVVLLPGDTIVVPEAGEIQVDGEVKQPGSFKLGSRMTLLGAIAASGGLTYSADVAHAEVIRDLQQGKKALLTVDLQKLATGTGKDVRLQNGDLVRIPSHGGRFITRQIVDGLNSLFSFGVGGTVR